MYEIKDNKPPSTKKVYFWTMDNEMHIGFFLKDANKYVRNVNRWKDTDSGQWYDDDEVLTWEYFSTDLKED